MHFALLWVALAFYGLGIILTLPSIIQRRPSLSRTALGALGFGLISHGAALAVQAAVTHSLPVVDVRSALSVFSFLATLAFFFVYLRYRITSLGIFMLPLAFVLTLISAVHAETLPLSPEFRSGWLVVHITSILLGYVGVFLTFVAATMYLIQERELKSKRPHAFYYRLPSLEICDELYFRSLIFGLPFLTLGIVTGFIGASREWKGPWELDPKIFAALITWLIYLVLFSTRLSGNWRGRRSAYLAVFGFAAMMVTFLGISFLSGQHGYFPNFGNKP
ncbi:MAG: cytochrome C assembly family protein [Terriglobia bacterium]